MTPKEKAQELMKKMIESCNDWNPKYIQNTSFEELKEDTFGHEWFRPKQCALIAVDEIINNVELYSTYWQEVKQEIEKL